MGWTMPWCTITDEFDTDFGVDEWYRARPNPAYDLYVCRLLAL
jgi:predicted dithiol-disulfide oxidoreductase (DUF899 family)